MTWTAQAPSHIMGIVASLASAPVTMEILKDEFRRDRERRDDIK